MNNQKTDKAGNFKDGQWDVARLRFLVDFMKAAGVTTGRAAELMGLTRQAVYHWFVKDDMRMSQVYKLFELCGYRIVFEMEGESLQNELPVSVSMSVICPEGTQRLAFLKTAFDRYNVSKESLAEKLNVGKATLYNWLKSDDCFLSYVYAIAVAEGWRLSIRIEPSA